jgi:cyclohexanecarboxylate-CoA ligase
MSMPAFQSEADAYYAQGYWRSGDLWSDFAARVREQPEKPALRAGDRSISYGELECAAIALSGRLAAASVEPGDVVLLLGRHSIEAAVGLLGCLHRGVVLAPLPPMFNQAQLSALIDQTQAKALLCFGGEAEIAKCQALEAAVPLVLALRPELLDTLVAERPSTDREPLDADALTLVLHSSGTTSAPKGVMHSSNTLRYASEQVRARWELNGADIALMVVEFGFIGSLVFGYLPVLLSGATGVVLTRWDGAEALRLIEEHRCTYVLLMPTHATDVLHAAEHAPRDCSSLRSLAAPGLSPERRIAVYETFGRPPLADYGLSEVPGHVAHGRSETWEKMVKTEGLPYEGTEVRILGDDGSTLPPGEVGAVVVNGPSRFLGFLGNDELTRESLTDWGGYKTGDLGYLDEDGHLVYVGRSKDIIRRGGVTIVPTEIEPIIARHPAIREVAVVALPDDRLGERGCAAVIAAPGHTAPTLPELQEFLTAQGVAKYTWPESVEVFEDFPRTPSLKAVKRDIVQQILERTAAPA